MGVLSGPPPWMLNLAEHGLVEVRPAAGGEFEARPDGSASWGPPLGLVDAVAGALDISAADAELRVASAVLADGPSGVAVIRRLDPAEGAEGDG